MHDLADSDDELWQLHIALANYSPDVVDGFRVQFHDYTRTILVDEYLSEIYVERTTERFESRLAREAACSSKVLFLVGERGSGKTSALLWVQRHLRVEAPELRYELIDIRRAVDSLELGSIGGNLTAHDAEPEQVLRAFKELIRDELLQRLFPGLDDIRACVAWTLSGPPDETCLFTEQVVSDLHPLYLEAERLAHWQPEQTREERRKSLLETISEDPQAYRLLREPLMQKLRATHITHAYTYLNDIHDKVLIVLDNVDRIPTELQPCFRAACRDIHLACGHTGSVLAAVRMENVSGVEAASGDELFAEVIMPDGFKYSGVLLPSLEADHASQVLERRATFADKILREYDEQHKTQWGNVQRMVLQPYYRSIVREFVEQRVHALTNDSCRTLLKLFVEFLRFIWTATERKDLETGRPLLSLATLQREGGRYLQTLFFVMLNQCGTDIGIPLHQIIEEDLDLSEDQFARATSPKYLLLSCIHSLTGHQGSPGRHTHYPRWEEVVSNMEDLGFSYEAIRSVLGEYLARIGEPPGMLQLVRRELTADELTADSQERVMLTKLGREVLTNVISSVGYIWGVAHRELSGRRRMLSYFEYGADERARHIYDFAKRVSRDHLKALSMLFSEWGEKHEPSKADYYRRYYGVNRDLQCEAILRSAGGFYRHMFPGGPAGNPFERLRLAFRGLFVKLSSEGELTNDDLMYLQDGDEAMRQMESREAGLPSDCG